MRADVPAGCATDIAGAVALSFGFGLVFWKNAVVAEVYTLASVQLFAVFLALVRWHDDRRPKDFYLAVACTGLIASHHTAELLMVPVLVAFVLSVDARWALRPGVLIRSGLIVLAALLPYAWVIYRTHRWLVVRRSACANAVGRPATDHGDAVHGTARRRATPSTGPCRIRRCFCRRFAMSSASSRSSRPRRAWRHSSSVSAGGSRCC